MKADRLVISAGQWLGWQELPPRPGPAAVWDCTPILITAVTPLKSGKGILRLGFVAAIHPIGPTRRTIDLRVTIHRPDYLVGTFTDEAGTIRTGILVPIDIGWIENRCGAFWSRFPADDLARWPESVNWPFKNVQDYLQRVFGRAEADVLAGTTGESFKCEKPPMPDQHSTITLGRELSAFDSYLVRRGFRPLEMEDKWFIYLEDEQLLFRRSWTGIPIYAVEAQRRGDVLYLGTAVVNRNPAHYKISDDGYDRDMLRFLIDRLLLRQPAVMPASPHVSDDQQAIAAWASTGKASL
ncbi:MAG: hypothetical protein AB7G10_05925 [Reyranellaceae bacterium]